MTTRAAVIFLVGAVLTAGAMPIIWWEWKEFEAKAKREDAEFPKHFFTVYGAAYNVTQKAGDPYEFQPAAKEALPALRRFVKRQGTDTPLGKHIQDAIPLIEEAQRTPAKEMIEPLMQILFSARYALEHPPE